MWSGKRIFFNNAYEFSSWFFSLVGFPMSGTYLLLDVQLIHSHTQIKLDIHTEVVAAHVISLIFMLL